MTANITESLRALAVPLDSLTPDPRNARRHPERNLAAIEASLRAYGQLRPLVVRREGRVVLAGNGTLEAARRLGWTHVAAALVDLDATSATGYALADNRSAELAEWDLPALEELIGGLEGSGVPLSDLALGPTDLDQLLGGVGAVGTVSLPDLPTGDHSGTHVRTFTLSAEQAAAVDSAVRGALQGIEVSASDNRNGAALAAVCRAWLDRG
jgi:ParB-like chromosome segregation protein Spo0J